MLKNKIIVRKIRNIIILLMALIIMFGIYRNIRDSRAEDVIEIGAVAVDNYAILNNEEFILEAKEVNENLFEIEMPTSINGKVVNKIISVTLEDLQVDETEGKTTTVEVVDNKIQLTGEQLETKQIVIEAEYQSALLTINEDGMLVKEILYEKADEEKAETVISPDVSLLYNKILTYEDEENGILVQVTGYLSEAVRLDVQEKQQEELTEIFGKMQMDLAYEIKLLVDVVTEVPIDEADPNGKVEQVIETIEIDPLKEFGEGVQVLINDTRIKTESKVYFVTDENTYNETVVNENIEGSINFDGYNSTIYAVKSEQSTPIYDMPGDFAEDSTEDEIDGELDIGGGLEDEVVGASLSTYKHLFNPWERIVYISHWLLQFYGYFTSRTRGRNYCWSRN